ncbi:MAG: hypothetical protein WBG86_03755 [Polyangiales bacterium]
MPWGDEWCTRQRDKTLEFACDTVLPNATDAWYRAIDVAAPSSTTFRWICQLRVAPYSYDWIDNRGRTSPRSLTPDVDVLAPGQTVMSVFDLVSFEPGAQLTMQLKRTNVFPPIAITYLVVPDGGDASRIVVKVLVRYGGLRGALLRPWLARADLFMMKKQLRTLRDLAEEHPKP